VTFLVIGFYGGFIQIANGLPIMMALLLLTRLNLTHINAHKMTVTASYSLVAIAFFAWRDQIAWRPAMALIIGQALGGWVGSHLSLRSDPIWIRRAMVVAVMLIVLKLLGVQEWMMEILCR
jgi:uncharacterized protein